MGLQPGKALADITIDKVFIGSCTNSRIEDMREAAAIVKKLGQKVAKNVKLAMVVPGSGLVKEQAEREALLQAQQEAVQQYMQANPELFKSLQNNLQKHEDMKKSELLSGTWYLKDTIVDVGPNSMVMPIGFGGEIEKVRGQGRLG